MISSITKPQIQSDFSYVLKTAQLEQILINNNIRTDTIINYWKPQSIGSIFEVHFWLPNDRNLIDRLYIRAGAVLKKDVQNAREALLNKVFPEFLDWIKNIEKLETTSPLRKERYFNAYFQNNKVSIIKE